MFPSAADRAQQKTPNYQQGYDDGCAAASTAGANPREGASRDEELYESDKAYRAGWGSGFSTCHNQSGNPAVDNSLLNQTPGQH